MLLGVGKVVIDVLDLEDAGLSKDFGPVKKRVRGDGVRDVGLDLALSRGRSGGQEQVSVEAVALLLLAAPNSPSSSEERGLDAP